jgi:hypothetical protein
LQAEKKYIDKEISPFLFGLTRVGTHGFILVKQAPYHLSHTQADLDCDPPVFVFLSFLG